MVTEATRRLKPKLFVVYVGAGSDRKFVVRAKTEQAALTFIARKTMSAHLASQEEAWELAKTGIEYEDAVEPDDDMLVKPQIGGDQTSATEPRFPVDDGSAVGVSQDSPAENKVTLPHRTRRAAAATAD